MGLEAEIWASRLGEGGAEEEKEKKEEKIPHMCESIGHRPLWGRCPKSDFTHAKKQGTPLCIAPKRKTKKPFLGTPRTIIQDVLATQKSIRLNCLNAKFRLMPFL